MSKTFEAMEQSDTEPAMPTFAQSLIRTACDEDGQICVIDSLSNHPGADEVVEKICNELCKPSDDESGHSEQAIHSGILLELISALIKLGVTITDTRNDENIWIREESVESMAMLLFYAAVAKLRTSSTTLSVGKGARDELGDLLKEGLLRK